MSRFWSPLFLCGMAASFGPSLWDARILWGQTPLANSPVEATQARLILVVGASGTAEFASQFESDAAEWVRFAKSKMLDLVEIREASADGSREQREQLKAAIERSSTPSNAPLWIVLIGHGTSEKNHHKFNLVGTDVDSKELTDWFRKVSRPIIFINCSSASAPYLPELSGPRRIVITATRSGSENNYSRFGSQLASSVMDPNTDIDHDEEVSLLEAFLAASAKTEKFYREQNRLATEHALLDDNGDRLGTGSEFFRGTRPVKAAQSGKQPDGAIAAKLMLYSSPSLKELSPEAVARRDELETQLNELRARKPNPPTELYWNELEKLLVDLAKVTLESSVSR